MGCREGSEGEVTRGQGVVMDHGQADVMGNLASRKQKVNLMHRD